MNEPHDNDRDLQQRLDEAARLCRADDPGWDSLLDRLPPRKPAKDTAARPEKRAGARSRPVRRWTILAVVGCVSVALALGIWLLPGRAETLPIEVRRIDVEVTIFSASDNTEPTLYMPTAQNPSKPSPGMALVKDRRMILHLQEGDNEVKFTDVAASIDPTSVRLVSDTDPIGTKVVEQNFEFDLATADGLLKRSLEQKITCIGKDNGKDNGELLEGYLLSYDDETIILADQKPSKDPEAKRPKTQAISRAILRAIRLNHKPTDLYTRPTLVWKLRTDRAGDHRTTLTYLCGNAVWRADYVAVIRETDGDRDALDLKSWVTIDNRSGTTYEDAGLKLIAGDVNRVRDPWAPREEIWAGARVRFIAGDFFAGKALVPEFAEKSFFEYKLYTLSQPSTIKDRQIKQLSLFEAEGIEGRRRYICRSQPGPGQRAEVQLVVLNKKQNELGRPLPKGKVALMAVDDDGDVQLLTRQDIDHTAKDEKFKLDLGRAFDVVYQYEIVDSRRPAEKQMVRTYRFRIRNHKSADIDVRVIAGLNEREKFVRYVLNKDGTTRKVEELREPANRSIIEASDKYTMGDYRTARFDVRVKANSEKTITYTVDYRW